MTQNKSLSITAAILGFIGIIAASVGAHYLGVDATEYETTTFKTGAHYQMIHALAMLFAASLSGSLAKWSAVTYGLGIALFSGSLYVFVLTGWTPIVMVAPVGGISLMAGWALLTLHYIKQ